MNPRILTLFVLSLLLPVAVQLPAHDDSLSRAHGETFVRAGAGYGHYAYLLRDCAGRRIDEVPVQSRDEALGVEHRFARVPIGLGVRGGWTSDAVGSASGPGGNSFAPPPGTTRNRYVNPYLVIEDRRASVSVGWVGHRYEFPTASQAMIDGPRDWTINDFSGHVRIGDVDQGYFLTSWMEGVPLYSDGGLFVAGGGASHPTLPKLHAFVGFTAGGPAEGAGPMTRVDWQFTSEFRAGIRAHTNTAGAYNVGLAFEYRIAR